MSNVVPDPQTSSYMISGSGQAVLVSGASFAGLATAFWLNRLGYRVTVVEVANELRRGGTPVDIEGETIAILTRMGLIDTVCAQALPPRAFAFKDADNVTLGAMGAGSPSDDDADERHEIHRDDLLDILSGGQGRCHHSTELEWRSATFCETAQLRGPRCEGAGTKSNSSPATADAALIGARPSMLAEFAFWGMPKSDGAHPVKQSLARLVVVVTATIGDAI